MKKNCDLSHDAITIVFSKYLIMNQHVSLKYRHERKQRMSSSRTSKPETLNDRSSKEVKTRQVQLTISQLEHITMPIMDNLGFTSNFQNHEEDSHFEPRCENNCLLHRPNYEPTSVSRLQTRVITEGLHSSQISNARNR
jgi:hypothetical protein